MSDWLELDLHGRVRMRVEAGSPPAPQLRDMFAPFLVDGPLAAHELTVAAGAEPLRGAREAAPGVRAGEDGLELAAAGLQVLVRDGGFRVASRRELLTAVVPLVDVLMVRSGAAMVHAAAVDHRGRGVLLAGAGGIGKTGAVVKLAREPGVRFMGDDWGFVSEAGEVLGYAKPLFVRPHHATLFPHLFRAKRKPLVPPRLMGAVEALATAVHPLLVRYPRLARRLRRLSPEHMIVPAERALPGAELSRSAPLAATVLLARAAGDEPRLLERDPAAVAARLAGDFHDELPRASRALLDALDAAGLVPLERLLAEKRAVLERALAGTAAYELQVPELALEPASDIIVERVGALLDRSGLAGGVPSA